MDKIFKLFKQNWQYVVLVLSVLLIFWDKIKSGFKSLFNPNAQERSDDNSSSDYLGANIPDEQKGVKVDSDGNEYFYYGKKKVRLTDGNKAKVVDYVNTVYEYCQNNTTDLISWLLDSNLQFNTGAIQATLNDYNNWCQRRETWIHYFAYVWLALHSVQFLEYFKCVVDGDGYDATRLNVGNLSMFYY